MPWLKKKFDTAMHCMKANAKSQLKKTMHNFVSHQYKHEKHGVKVNTIKMTHIKAQINSFPIHLCHSPLPGLSATFTVTTS